MNYQTSEISSLTIFFPAYNDAATIASLILNADQVAKKITPDYELLVINDGSQDNTAEILSQLQKYLPPLRIVTHTKNQGYGAALRSGFSAAKKDWIFYTDGDAQYDPRELLNLVEQSSGYDLVNGFKTKRRDPWHRIVIGRTYHWTVKILFGLKLKDVDCDFRLMKRSIFDKVQLSSNGGVICLEMMKKIQDAGFLIKEVSVTHYHRAHGKSQFFNFARIWAVGVGVMKLWLDLVFKPFWKKICTR